METFNNRWTGPGSTNSAPGADRDALASSYYLEKGDFFRINNITLGYTINQIGFLNRARLYLTAQIRSCSPTTPVLLQKLTVTEFRIKVLV